MVLQELEAGQGSHSESGVQVLSSLSPDIATEQQILLEAAKTT